MSWKGLVILAGEALLQESSLGAESQKSGISGFLYFCPVLHETFQSSISEWMAHQLAECFGRHCRRMCAKLYAL